MRCSTTASSSSSAIPSRSFTFVGDVVEATIAAMERAPAGAVYNVGGGEEATLREAIALLERVSGRTTRVRQGERARGDARRTAADVTRIGDELGWSPSTSLEDGPQSSVVLGSG